MDSGQGDMFGLTKDQMIQELREENQRMRNTKKGTYCVVCDRKNKVYTRSMYGQMIVTLISLYRKTGQSGDFLHLTAFQEGRGKNKGFSGGGDFVKLRYWDFVAEGIEAANWRITSRGIEFLTKNLSVLRSVRIYNDVCLGYALSSRMVRVRDVLGTKFSFDELMSR